MAVSTVRTGIYDFFSSKLGRFLADTLKGSVAELRKDEEARISL